MSGLCLARKLDALMERMMDAMSLERMTDQMSGVCLEKRKVGLMERTMDQLSAMSSEEWKVDLTVTMLGYVSHTYLMSSLSSCPNHILYRSMLHSQAQQRSTTSYLASHSRFWLLQMYFSLHNSFGCT